MLRTVGCPESLTVLEVLDGWTKVRDKDGTEGYVVTRYYQNMPLITLEDVPESTIPATGYSFEEIIYAGDSRFMELHHFVGFEKGIYRSDTGYDWFVENFGQIRECYTPGSVIVIEFGVNDTKNIDLYLEFVNGLAEEGFNLAFLTVMPVKEDLEALWGYGNRNSAIDNFNRKLKEGLDKRIILLDANAYLKTVGFDSYDGLHYTVTTYQIIDRYIKRSLLK